MTRWQRRWQRLKNNPEVHERVKMLNREACRRYKAKVKQRLDRRRPERSLNQMTSSGMAMERMRSKWNVNEMATSESNLNHLMAPSGMAMERIQSEQNLTEMATSEMTRMRSEHGTGQWLQSGLTKGQAKWQRLKGDPARHERNKERNREEARRYYHRKKMMSMKHPFHPLAWK
ncbi:hypothetical protein ACOMHN_036049 [Nucella lapillus]